MNDVSEWLIQFQQTHDEKRLLGLIIPETLRGGFLYHILQHIHEKIPPQTRFESLIHLYNFNIY